MNLVGAPPVAGRGDLQLAASGECVLDLAVTLHHLRERLADLFLGGVKILVDEDGLVPVALVGVPVTRERLEAVLESQEERLVLLSL